ncbi:hypothetical protein BDZ94DRAFT_1316495 [Collybia nuda]|uniref:Uncharacterized protein n=1 Tax=Collybia nuda TaxID=64659 RepID=A0A9P5XQT2_9AGAR|nr:hypothetical protein BDZ94DRAFT_1316495 [Collybia nuda]
MAKMIYFIVSVIAIAINPKDYILTQWDSSTYFTFLVSIYVRLVALVALLILRIHHLHMLRNKLGYKILWHRFDFGLFVGQHEAEFIYFFGKSVFTSRYLKEHLVIRGFRALLSYIIIGGIIYLAFLYLVLGPVREGALPPVQIFSSPLLSLRELQAMEDPVYRVFVILHNYSSASKDQVGNAINITALWNQDVPETATRSCGLENVTALPQPNPISEYNQK